MGFLKEYEVLYSAEARKTLLSEWIFKRRQELFAELREQAPIFETPDFILVSQHQDVKDILRDSARFSVKPYADAGSKDFVLGKNQEQGHEADRAFLESLLPQEELERVYQIAASAAAKILAPLPQLQQEVLLPGRRSPRPPSGRIDLPTTFARLVSVAVAQHYFGVTDPDPILFGAPPLPPRRSSIPLPDPRPLLDPTFPCVSNWTATLNGAFIYGAFGRHFSQDLAVVQALLVRVPQVKKDFATHIATLIENMRQNPQTGSATILQRLVEKGTSVEEITRDLLGMINGMVDNVTSAVCNAMDVLLSHPEQLATARAIAHTVTPATQPEAALAANQTRRQELWRYIREALRFYAPVPFLLRQAYTDTPLAQGTTRQTILSAEKPIFIAICSAMMDERKIAAPFEFRPDRVLADEDDLLFGSGWHSCFGKYIAQPQITEMIRSLLVLQDLRRAPGPAGNLEYDHFFAKSFVVDFGPKPVQNPLTAIMTIKPPEAVHARALKLLLSIAYQPVVDILDRVGTVHFARFVFLENNTKLALITSYDGSFDTYIKNYIEVAGVLFDLMLEHIKDAPPLPVRKYREEFIEYVRRVDVVSDSQFYSAYGELTVQDIIGLQRR